MPGVGVKLSGVVKASCNPVDTGSIGSNPVSCSAEDRAGNTAKGDAVYSVVYDWTGFFRPVDNNIVNVADAGSAIPVKFSLSGDQSLDIFATAADGTSYPKSGVTACDPTAQVDAIEQTVVASASGLTYDASIDQYTYVWKTGKTWAGSCRQLVAKLNGGTVHRAYFKFK